MSKNTAIITVYEHAWSGHPGAFCLKCGAECLIELAIGTGLYNPFTEVWVSPEAQEEYTDKPCPVSDAEHTAWLALPAEERQRLNAEYRSGSGRSPIEILRERMRDG